MSILWNLADKDYENTVNSIRPEKDLRAHDSGKEEIKDYFDD